MGSPPPSLAYEDLAVIEANVTGINGISAEQNTTQEVKANDETLTDISIVGTTSGFIAVREYLVADGRFISEEDTDRANKVAVLGHDIAIELFGDPADGGINPVGQSITIGTTKCTIIGVMQEKGVVGNTDYDSRVYIPITLVFKRFTTGRFRTTDLRVVYVSAESKEVMDDVMAQLGDLATEILGDEGSFQMTTQDSIIDMQASTTETFRNLLAWVAAVSLVVGGIGIMNIMLVSVT